MSVKSRLPIYVRATAIVLLIAMFHYVAGYRLMYSLGILYAKEDAKACMTQENGNTKKITFSVSDFNSLKWNEQNKEFLFHNEMYDVKTMQKSGNTYIVYAYQDNIETEIITALNNLEKELFHPDQTSKGAKSAENIMSSFQKDCTAASEFKINMYVLSGLLQSGFVAQQNSLQVFNTIWHPPASC